MCFFTNYLFIHEYLFCPLQSNPHQILHTCAHTCVALSWTSSVSGTRKSHREPDQEYGGCGITSMLFGVIMVQKPIFVLPQIRAFLTNCFSQFVHNLHLIFLIFRSTLWQELMIHHELKKSVIKTFSFDRTWRAFSGLGSCGSFHWDD